MAVTYDFQTPGVSTSAADTQEDIRNIAEAAATGFNSSHTLSNMPTGSWRMEGIGYSNQANFQYYNGSSWDDMKFSKIHLNNNGLVLVNEIGVHTLEFIAMGDTPGYVTTGASSWFIQSDFLSVGTSTFDPILGFMNQGTERARIYTDTSDSHKLKFDVGGADRITVDSSGNVGIGTSSPLELLTVKAKSTNTTALKVEQANDTQTAFSVSVDGSDNGQFGLFDASESTKVFIRSNGNSFFNGGNVGIGTSSPSHKLDVVGDIQVEDFIRNSLGESMIGFLEGTSDDHGITIGSSGESAGNKYDRILFSLNNAERMRIDSSGNVGIGTSSPSGKLDIALATENFAVVDAGSTSATEQDWIEVTVGGITGYIRVYATK